MTGSRLSAFPAPLITRLFLSASQEKKKNKTFKEGFLKQHNEIPLQILLPRMRGEVRENTKSFV